MQGWNVKDEDQRQLLIKHLKERKIPFGVQFVSGEEAEEEKTRTLEQNSALHQYFKMLAKDLNDAGYDVPTTLKTLFTKLGLPWNERLVKEMLWKAIQEDILGKKSTTKLNTTEVNEVYQALSRGLAERLGVSTPFPDRFNEEFQ